MTYDQRALELVEVIFKSRSVIVKCAKRDNHKLAQRAKALLIAMELEVAASYATLLDKSSGRPFITRAILMRSLIEYRANSLHIGNNVARAENYLSYTEQMNEILKRNTEELNSGVKHREHGTIRWTKSSVRDRVSLINEIIPVVYDSLSDFVHGNNIPDFFNDKELVSSFDEALTTTYIGILLGMLLDIGSNFTEELLELDIHQEMLELIKKDVDLIWDN